MRRKESQSDKSINSTLISNFRKQCIAKLSWPFAIAPLSNLHFHFKIPYCSLYKGEFYLKKPESFVPVKS